jgi:hypothetical protein
MDSNLAVKTNRRLIVLVSDCLDNPSAFAYKIRWMAMRDRCDVVFLALANGEDELLEMSREMTTVKAVASDPGYEVKVIISRFDDWANTLQSILEPGDVILCPQEQTIRTGALRVIPMDDYIQNTLKYPVHTIAGFYQPGRARLSHWLQGLKFWAGILIIMAGFFWVEANLDAGAHGVAGTVMLMMAVLLEIGAIVAWSAISG